MVGKGHLDAGLQIAMNGSRFFCRQQKRHKAGAE
jgi:hypothetical protein